MEREILKRKPMLTKFGKLSRLGEEQKYREEGERGDEHSSLTKSRR